MSPLPALRGVTHTVQTKPSSSVTHCPLSVLTIWFLCRGMFFCYLFASHNLEYSAQFSLYKEMTINATLRKKLSCQQNTCHTWMPIQLLFKKRVSYSVSVIFEPTVVTVMLHFYLWQPKSHFDLCFEKKTKLGTSLHGRDASLHGRDAPSRQRAGQLKQNLEIKSFQINLWYYIYIMTNSLSLLSQIQTEIHWGADLF